MLDEVVAFGAAAARAGGSVNASRARREEGVQAVDTARGKGEKLMSRCRRKDRNGGAHWKRYLPKLTTVLSPVSSSPSLQAVQGRREGDDAKCG